MQGERTWFDGVQNIGITAGASAPEVLIDEVIQTLQAWGADAPISIEGREENITFSLPKALRESSHVL